MRVAGNWTPVLMLTAREAVSDRVAGLDAGADDYLAKPFALEELLARLRALVRRSTFDGASVELSFRDLVLDLRRHEARRGSRQIELTRTAFQLLELFLRNPRQVLTRTTIFERVWGVDLSESSNSLSVYIGYLRRKTEAGDDRGWSTRCMAWATLCESHDAAAPANDSRGHGCRTHSGRRVDRSVPSVRVLRDEMTAHWKIASRLSRSTGSRRSRPTPDPSRSQLDRRPAGDQPSAVPRSSRS